MLGKANYFSLIILVVIGIKSSEAFTPFKQCADIRKPLPLMVALDDCTTMPCDMWRGGNTYMEVQFVATKNLMRHLIAYVDMTTLGIKIPFELEESRRMVCNNLLHEAYCPLYAGEDVTYALELPIPESQPEVPTKLEVTIKDTSDNSVVACFIVDTRVKKLGKL